MWPDRVSNPGPLNYESGALPIALRGPANGISQTGFDVQAWRNSALVPLITTGTQIYRLVLENSKAVRKGRLVDPQKLSIFRVQSEAFNHSEF